MNRVYALIVSFLLIFLAACTEMTAATPTNAAFTTEHQEYSMMGNDAVEARSADGQAVTVDITIIFQIEAENLERVQNNFPDGDYTEKVIRPALRSATRELMADYPARELYMIEDPEELNSVLKRHVSEIISVEGVSVVNIFLSNISFSPEFIAIIEAEIQQTEATATENRP
jgi:regulator of protease activity HflC (stomatin/prohibitin superfamily)